MIVYNNIFYDFTFKILYNYSTKQNHKCTFIKLKNEFESICLLTKIDSGYVSLNTTKSHEHALNLNQLLLSCNQQITQQQTKNKKISYVMRIDRCVYHFFEHVCFSGQRCVTQTSHHVLDIYSYHI